MKRIARHLASPCVAIALLALGIPPGAGPVAAAAAKPTTKACSLLNAADFKKAGVTVKLGPATENDGNALAPGGSACDWTADGTVIELATGRNLAQRTIMQFFATRTVPIVGLPSGSVYVEADTTSTQDAYNGIVVKRGTLVVTLQATLETVPKPAMLALARVLSARAR